MKAPLFIATALGRYARDRLREQPEHSQFQAGFLRAARAARAPAYRCLQLDQERVPNCLSMPLALRDFLLMESSSVDLDEVIRRAAVGTAGELQVDIAQTSPEQTTEADLRRALRRALQALLGPVVHVETPTPALESWTGRLGAIDVAAPGRLACEVKWCRHPEKIGEALWDALKLSALESETGLAAYLIYAAPCNDWAATEKRPVALLEDGEHDVAELLERFAGFWRMWLPKGASSPRVVSARRWLTTHRVTSMPIHVADGDDWQLRGVRVYSHSDVLAFGADGWPIAGQSATAPPSRFMDTDEDVQIDPATTPGARVLLRKLNAGEQQHSESK